MKLLSDASPAARERLVVRLASLWLPRAARVRWWGWDPDERGR